MKIKKAMILAAGFGTRLKPLTETKPKALVKINGITLLDQAIEKLVKYGIEEITINAHHFSDMMIKHINDNSFNVKINLLVEDEILGTGGGIKNAEKYLGHSGNFFVYNADVRSDIDLNEMEKFYFTYSPLAMLAIQTRDTSRPLIIDDNSDIIGRKGKEKDLIYSEPAGKTRYIGFMGIHIISDVIFEKFESTGFFDIFTEYFRLISQGETIKGFNADKYNWMDMGTINDDYEFS